MSLRTKTFYFITLSSAALLLMIYLISSKVMISDYVKSEKQDIHMSMDQVLNLIQSDLKSLYSSAVSWSCWDDTYDFMGADGKPSANDPYLERNYAPGDFQAGRLDDVIYLNPSGEVVLALEYDEATETVHRTSEPVLNELRKHVGKLAAPSDFTEVRGGFLVLDGQPTLLVSTPILTSNFEGVSRGSVIMTRKMDDTFIQFLTDQLKISLRLSLIEPSNDVSREDTKVAKDGIIPFSNERTKAINEEKAAGYVDLHDMEGKPALTIEVERSRWIFQQGLQSFRILLSAIFVAAILFAIGIVVFMNRHILARMKSYSDGLSAITKNMEFSSRLQVAGRDELSQMGTSFNRLMDELESYQRLLNYRAHHDPLTGLSNRQYFNEVFERKLLDAKQAGGKLTTVFIDLNKFKMVNDHYGHEVGDQLLVYIAGVLKESISKHDIAARLGGDEFLILSTRQQSREEAKAWMTGIAERLAKPVTILGVDIPVGISFGISQYPEDGDDLAALVRSADIRMFEQKGRNAISGS